MKPVKAAVLEELSRLLPDIAATMIKDVPPDIEGDYSFPCFAHAKKSGKDPKAMAQELAPKLSGNGVISRTEAKDGFVNIFIDAAAVGSELVREVDAKKAHFGSGKKGEKIILEHTSANPDAPLHVGHLRNSIIGDSMARILRFAGYEVEAQFYVNDMGGQLAVLASYLDGKDYKRELAASGKKPDAWLGEIYVAANKSVDEAVAKALQKNYERGAAETRKIFDFIVETALEGFRGTFKDYNIHLDKFVRESDFVFKGDVRAIVDKLKKSPYWFEEEGMSAVDLEKYGIDKELVLLRSDGTTLYTTRDLAYHQWKLKTADCINVIANEQTLQQKQLRAGLDMLGVPDAEKRVRHLSYELVTVPGMRMSSRSGQFISADELLASGEELAMTEIRERKLEIPESESEHIAKAVAAGAIRFNIVRITPLKPIEFKWDDALNFEGESAPYLQYSHARACRILEKAGGHGKADFGSAASQLSPEDKKLILALSKFPEVVEASAADLKPNLVANYLFTLGEAFNRFYFKCPVVDSPEPLRSARIELVKSFKQVVANGLSLLGIEPLERM